MAETISTTKAMELAKEGGIPMTLPSVISYVNKYPHLGYQLGGANGRWIIHEDKWIKFLAGEKV